MAALRRRLATWEEPVELCGDWLDSHASEAAIATGEEAAERLASKMRRRARAA